MFCRIATHLSTAYRLQRRLAKTTTINEGVEAILDTTGRFQHLEGAARIDGSAQLLADAFQKIEWARGKEGRRDPIRAVGSWRGVVTGRWTLVDRLESDGKRYILARENTPKPSGLASLSDRERQVAALAARGRTNKLIAYELGLAPATVRVLLARAAAKLHVKSRAQLISKVQQDSAQ